jgi:2-polyprenyl-3-methyl-5-hydroxy-6-metoxy-1,4-benzoquinol methylase
MLNTTASSSVLELGCGAGGTGRAALKAGKAGRYVGIELSDAAAGIAREHLSEVIVGNVEQLDLAALSGQFDALIVSEVLEHLVDPWAALERLVGCLKPGGEVYASSPNLAQWQVIMGLLGGRFEYAASGVMDRTHLRWFTPQSYRQMFEAAGVQVREVRAIRRPGWKARLVNQLTAGRFSHLFMTQILIAGTRRA